MGRHRRFRKPVGERPDRLDVIIGVCEILIWIAMCGVFYWLVVTFDWV